MPEHTDSPRVRILPPLFYAAAVIGGWLLDRRWSLPIGAGSIRPMLAWLLVGIWIMLQSSSYRSFWRKRTSVIPTRPATALVLIGPYKFSRNPMYLGLALLTVALAHYQNTWWRILLLVPTLFTVKTYVIAREEAYLRRRFGVEYEAYMRQVRRWL